jgi:hypothetical protein
MVNRCGAEFPYRHTSHCPTGVRAAAIPWMVFGSVVWAGAVLSVALSLDVEAETSCSSTLEDFNDEIDTAFTRDARRAALHSRRQRCGHEHYERSIGHQRYGRDLADVPASRKGLLREDEECDEYHRRDVHHAQRK